MSARSTCGVRARIKSLIGVNMDWVLCDVLVWVPWDVTEVDDAVKRNEEQLYTVLHQPTTFVPQKGLDVIVVYGGSIYPGLRGIA
jgi:hypothetical protein